MVHGATRSAPWSARPTPRGAAQSTGSQPPVAILNAEPIPEGVVVADTPPVAAAINYPLSEALAYDAPWSWQLMPQGLIWHSYLAGVKEARMASVFNYQKGLGWLWDPVAGGRVGLLRYGTPNAFRPEGWQLDVEGAAFPELH